MYRRSPLNTARDRRASAWRSEFCTRRAMLVSLTDRPLGAEPAPPNLWTINGASAHGKRMSDRVTNKSAAAEQSQVRLQEMAPPSSISSSDKLLSRIAILLFILVVYYTHLRA